MMVMRYAINTDCLIPQETKVHKVETTCSWNYQCQTHLYFLLETKKEKITPMEYGSTQLFV